MIPKRVEKYNLGEAPDKANCHRVSRFKLSLKYHFMFLSFEFYWGDDKNDSARLFRGASRDKLQCTRQ